MNDKEFNTFLNSIMAKREYMLVVRKHVSSFIEKILRCLGHDFRHDVFKSVVYGEKPYITPEEEKWKSYNKRKRVRNGYCTVRACLKITERQGGM